MIKEKAFYSYPFQEKCILQRKFKNEKKTQRIPISGWRIHWNQASLDPHTSLPSRGGPRKSQRVERCSRSFNAYRSGASPSFSLSLISSSFFYPLCSSRVSSLLPLVCFSRRDDWRIDSVREAGTKGGAVWPSPSCLRGPKVMWRRRLARKVSSSIGQIDAFRPTWLNLEIRVCVNIWTLRCFRVTVWHRFCSFSMVVEWMMRVVNQWKDWFYLFDVIFIGVNRIEVFIVLILIKTLFLEIIRYICLTMLTCNFKF